PLAHAGRGGGGIRLKATRKNFAVTEGKETVCSGAPPLGSFTMARNSCPSSLASRDISGLVIPANIAAIIPTFFIATVTERIVWGSANSYWIQELSPAAGMGSLVVFSKSPSLSIAASIVPALAVTFGCSDSIGTSLAAAR